MSPEDQRIAIAEACGAIEVHTSKTGLWAWFPKRLEGSCYIINPPGKEKLFLCPVPNYEEDLNEMHEMFLSLSPNSRELFADELCWVVGLKPDGEFGSYRIGRLLAATAAQWAEAFLKTEGKWKP